MDALFPGRPLVFGHRGASAYAPMNTLPAFELAAQQDADGVELDVWLTRDDQLVVIHDASLDATTNGSGRVTEMTLAQLKELDAGIGFGDSFRGTRIPTLDEVFEAVGQKLLINVEIKSNYSWRTRGIEHAVALCITRFGLQQRVIVSSFDPLVLRRFRRLSPSVAVGFLHSRQMPFFARFLLWGVRLQADHPHHELVDSAYMDWAQRRSYRINTWTVNDPARAVQLRDLGVNALITDKPDVICQSLQSPPAEA